MTHQFRIDFDNSEHWVEVLVHSSTRAMRAALRREGYINGYDAAAATGRSESPELDGRIANVHFAAETMCMNYIAHEAAHVGLFRAYLIGSTLGSDDFGEDVAETTGELTNKIVAELRSQKIKIYDSL